MFFKGKGSIVYASAIISSVILVGGSTVRLIIAEKELANMRHEIELLREQVDITRQIIELPNQDSSVEHKNIKYRYSPDTPDVRVLSSAMHIRFYDCEQDPNMRLIADSSLRYRTLIIGVGIRDSADNSVSEVDYIWGAYRELRVSSVPPESRDTSKQSGFSNQLNVLPHSRRDNSRKPMATYKIAHVPQGLPAFDTTLTDFVYPTAGLSDFIKSNLFLYAGFFFKRGCYLDLEVDIRFQDNWRVHEKLNKASFDKNDVKAVYVFKLPRPSKN